MLDTKKPGSKTVETHSVGIAHRLDLLPWLRSLFLKVKIWMGPLSGYCCWGSWRFVAENWLGRCPWLKLRIEQRSVVVI